MFVDFEYSTSSSAAEDIANHFSEMMYDYMVLKFKKNSYLESMLFYQRTVAAVNLCLDSLDKIRQISIMQAGKTKRKNK